MKNVKECIFRMRKDMKNVGLVVIAVLFYLLIMLLLTGNTCIIRGLTGIPCPGCGMTRALGCLLRGQWSLSFQMHPMLLPWLAYFLYLFVTHYWIGKKPRFLILFLVLLCIGMFGVYLYRMVMFFPNQEPMTIHRTVGILPWNL